MTGGAEEAELLFLGFWTDKGECSEKIRKYMETLHGQKVVLFGTAGIWRFGAVFHTDSESGIDTSVGWKHGDRNLYVSGERCLRA